MNLTPDIKGMEHRVSFLSERMAKARAMLGLMRSEDYGEMTAWLAAEIKLKMEGLCNQEMDEKLTTAVRAEIWTLRRIQRLPDDMDAQMVAIADEVKGLREKMERLHNRGRANLTQALDTAESITKG